MTLLIDPHLLIVPTECGIIDAPVFWQRVVDIAAADHAQIGHEAFHWVVGQLAHLGYPEKQVDFGPVDFRRECQKAMERILSRVTRGSDEVEECTLSPDYRGSAEARLCILMDTTEHGDHVDALLSDKNHWRPSGDLVSVGKRDIELLFRVDQEPKSFATAAIKSVFAKRRVHVLGGSITDSALASLRSQLGLPDDAVHWITSEKSKPARDIDKRWAQLDPARDVAVCITGRVSHSVWEQGDKAAAKRGLEMIECSTQGQLVESLRSWARVQNRIDAMELAG
jgi:hypothetical protein